MSKPEARSPRKNRELGVVSDFGRSGRSGVLVGHVYTDSDNVYLFFEGSQAQTGICPGDAVTFERVSSGHRGGDAEQANGVRRVPDSPSDPALIAMLATARRPSFWRLVAADYLRTIETTKQVAWLKERAQYLTELPDEAWHALNPQALHDSRTWDIAPPRGHMIVLDAAPDYLRTIDASKQVAWLKKRAASLSKLPDEAWRALKPEALHDPGTWDIAPPRGREIAISVAADCLRTLDALKQVEWLRKRAASLSKLPVEAWRALKPGAIQDQKIWAASPPAIREVPIQAASELLEKDFLGSGLQFQASAHLYPPSSEIEKLKIAFVKAWTREIGLPLDDDQARTVAAVDGDVQVVARAGSGKTRALVARAIFLQKHCKVHPRQMLLLAFNGKAAEEMRNRLISVLGDEVPHIMTFHALAYALVHPEEEIVYDDISADQLGVRREVQDVIDEHIRSGSHGKVIKELMLAHFREDWERIEEGRFTLPMHEFLDHRRSLPRETLNGEYVKSFGEKLIANTLFEHGIEYRYESTFRWNGTNYRPDFLIGERDEGGIVIEYFGLAGDADYDELSEHKREFWANPERAAKWRFLEYAPASISDGGLSEFVNRLVADLRNCGLVPTRLTEEEIWQRVRRRAIDSFTKAMRQFVGRCRKHGLSEDELANQISGHVSCSQAEELFLRIGKSVYSGYIQRLAKGGKEDFDGLMWRAERAVREGLTRFARNKGKEQGDLKSLRFAMVDEFQDFSEMFSRLLGAIRAQNPAVNFFCVGDDWQAINSFAGSDLQYFETFQERFRRPSRLHITTNWRSHRAIVEAGNAIMRGLGEPARVHETAGSGECLVGRLSDFTPTGAEERQHEGDELTPAVLRIVSGYLNRGKDVVLLSRRNGLPWYVKYLGQNRADDIEKFQEHVRSFLPEEDRRRVTASTTHKYKGLEKQAVVVLDALARSYPLVHPHWVFLRVFGDGVDRIVAEERRLYYVALTRAVESVVLLTDGGRETPFLADMQGKYAGIDWPRLRPIAGQGDGVVEVRVHNAFDVKDQLKALGYTWAGQRNAANRYWRRSFRADSFDFERDILGQDWARHEGVIVGAYAEDGELIHGREPEAQGRPQRFARQPIHRLVVIADEYDPFED